MASSHDEFMADAESFTSELDEEFAATLVDIREQARAQAKTWATAHYDSKFNAARTRAEAECKSRLQAETDKQRARQKELEKAHQAQMDEMRDRAIKDASELQKEIQKLQEEQRAMKTASQQMELLESHRQAVHERLINGLKEQTAKFDEAEKNRQKEMADLEVYVETKKLEYENGLSELGQTVRVMDEKKAKREAEYARRTEELDVREAQIRAREASVLPVQHTHRHQQAMLQPTQSSQLRPRSSVSWPAAPPSPAAAPTPPPTAQVEPASSLSTVDFACYIITGWQEGAPVFSLVDDELLPDLSPQIDATALGWLAAYNSRTKRANQTAKATVTEFIDDVIANSTHSACIGKQAANQGASKWTKERPGQYACFTCANNQRLCFNMHDKKVVLLSLPPDVSQDGFEFVTEELSAIKGNKAVRGLWT